MQNKLTLAGIIVAAHGIKGHAIIKSFTDPITNICNLALVNIHGDKFNLKLIKQNNKNQLICVVNEIKTRNDIENILKTQLYYAPQDLPILEKNEFYTYELKNLKVYIAPSSSKNEMQEIGIIHNIYNFGAGDIIEIKLQDNSTILLPFTHALFPEVHKEYVVLSDISMF